jgi:hypothetical protein
VRKERSDSTNRDKSNYQVEAVVLRLILLDENEVYFVLI